MFNMTTFDIFKLFDSFFKIISNIFETFCGDRSGDSLNTLF